MPEFLVQRKESGEDWGNAEEFTVTGEDYEEIEDDLYKWFNENGFEYDTEYVYRVQETGEEEWSNEKSYVWDLDFPTVITLEPTDIVEVEVGFPDADGYIYNEGDYEDKWEEGYVTFGDDRDDEFTKEDDHISIYVDDGLAEETEYAVVIEETVDLSEIGCIEIEWEAEYAYDGSAYLVVSTEQIGNKMEYDDRVSKIGSFSRETTSLSLDNDFYNDFYIRVHIELMDYMTGDWGECKFYSVQLIEE